MEHAFRARYGVRGARRRRRARRQGSEEGI